MNILDFQVWVGSHDLVGVHPVCHEVEEQGDRHTRMPRMQALPAMTFGSKVMRSKPSMFSPPTDPVPQP
jgi:hypothetical protein